MKKYIFALGIVYLIGVSGMLQAAKLEFIIPDVGIESHQYFHELLAKSLEAKGEEFAITTKEMPQKRAVRMLEQGGITLFWLIQSDQRDQDYLPVKVGLTNSLIGHRILFIPKGTQAQYDGVNSLEDFRKLGKVGGFGKNWFDVRVWVHNNLPVYEKDGDWNALYKMVASQKRGVDYFSRGFNEILAESEQHPDLEIENRLMLVYNRDFLFYLSKKHGQLSEVLQKALESAKQEGLMDQLIRKYWAQDFEKLKFDQRVKIPLETP